MLYAGLAHVDAGSADKGLPLIVQAVESNPGNVVLRVFYARALLDMGRIEAAEEQCSLVEAAQAEHPGAGAIRRLCLARRDLLAGLSSLALDGLSDDAHIQGRALLLAETVLGRAEPPVRTQPWPVGQKPWLPASAPADTGRPAAARARELARLSQSRQANGRMDEAIALAEAAMREGPSDARREALVMLYFEMGRYAEVDAAIRDYMPDDAERNMILGISRFHMGDFAGAVSALKALESPTPRAVHTLGMAYLALGCSSEARSAFVRTAIADDSIPAGRVARAYLAERERAGRG
jgi:tetratricopeptide (TPR) repeat protein